MKDRVLSPRFPVVGVLLLILLAASVPAGQTQGNGGSDEEFDRAFTDAKRFYVRRDWESAIKGFKQAISLRQQGCAECSFYLGQSFHQLGKFKDAAAAYRQAIGAGGFGDESDLYNWLGVALYAQRDKKMYDEAASAFKRAVELSGGKLVRAYYNLGYALIQQGKREEGATALQQYVDSKPSPIDAYQVRALIANPGLVNEQFAPAFKVKSATGEELSLEKLAGKVVLLDFWAVWCGPCRAEMPKVKRIWEQYRSDSFLIIGIDLDQNRRTFDEYLKAENITWPQYFDGRGWSNSVAQLYDVHAIPHTVLIDQDGIVRASGLRASALGSKIGDLLKKAAKQNGK